MYLSKLILNARNRGAAIDTENMYLLHQTLLSMLPKHTPADRYLFRLEETRIFNYILLQSSTVPNFEKHLEANYLLEAQTKKYSPVFKQGQTLRFCLFANAVKKRKYDPEKDTNVTKKGTDKVYVPMYSDEDMKQWLKDRAASNGFAIDEMQLQMSKAYLSFRKRSDAEQKGNLFGVKYEGYLQVTDLELFTKAVECGIGKAKSFGFGLLSVSDKMR